MFKPIFRLLPKTVASSLIWLANALFSTNIHDDAAAVSCAFGIRTKPIVKIGSHSIDFFSTTIFPLIDLYDLKMNSKNICTTQLNTL